MKTLGSGMQLPHLASRHYPCTLPRLDATKMKTSDEKEMDSPLTWRQRPRHPPRTRPRSAPNSRTAARWAPAGLGSAVVGVSDCRKTADQKDMSSSSNAAVSMHVTSSLLLTAYLNFETWHGTAGAPHSGCQQMRALHRHGRIRGTGLGGRMQQHQMRTVPASGKGPRLKAHTSYTCGTTHTPVTSQNFSRSSSSAGPTHTLRKIFAARRAAQQFTTSGPCAYAAT